VASIGVADEIAVKSKDAKIVVVETHVEEEQAMNLRGMQMMVNRQVKVSLLRRGVSKEKASYKTTPGLIRTRTMKRKMTMSTKQNMDCTELVGP